MKHWLQSGIIPDAGTAAVVEAYMALPTWDLQSGGERLLLLSRFSRV